MQTGEAGPSEVSDNDFAEPDRRVLEVLVCPLTKAALIYRRETHELLSPKAGLAFPIKDGVPLLTADAARPLADSDLPGR